MQKSIRTTVQGGIYESNLDSGVITANNPAVANALDTILCVRCFDLSVKSFTKYRLHVTDHSQSFDITVDIRDRQSFTTDYSGENGARGWLPP